MFLHLALLGGSLSWAASAPRPVHEIAFVVQESTQLNLAELSIGVGYVGYGAYIDDKGVRQNGLHASLAISIETRPPLHQTPDVHKGQVILVDGYRITIVDISTESRGAVVLEVTKENRGPESIGGHGAP